MLWSMPGTLLCHHISAAGCEVMLCPVPGTRLRLQQYQAAVTPQSTSPLFTHPDLLSASLSLLKPVCHLFSQSALCSSILSLLSQFVLIQPVCPFFSQSTSPALFSSRTGRFHAIAFQRVFNITYEYDTKRLLVKAVACADHTVVQLRVVGRLCASLCGRCRAPRCTAVLGRLVM